MAEEHRCQAPKLCANNCGFFGSPATQDLCSKCYRDLQLNEQQSSSAKLALNQTLTSAAIASSSADALLLNIKSPSLEVDQASADVADEARTSADVPAPSQLGRCMTCRRRVGLTGFKCRCGMVFCGTHRYPEQHRCDFDFKGTGKEQIARANPVIKGEKLQKI